MQPRVAIAVLILLVVLSGSALPARAADVTIIGEALSILHLNHWNPNLDGPALVRAGIPGVERVLRRAGVNVSLAPIPPDMNETLTLSALAERIDDGVRAAEGRVTERDLVHAALRASLAAVGGSHTWFLPPVLRSRVAASQSGPPLFSIGVVLARDAPGTTVIEVLHGGPAEGAGVRPGDVLLSVGDTALDDQTADEIYAMLLGPQGTEVTLALRRGSQALRLTVTRGPSRRPIAESSVLEGGIAYLHLFGYPPGSADDARHRLTELLALRPPGLVLDLRNNSGGSSQEGLQVLSLFLPHGARVFHFYRRDRPPDVFVTAGTPLAPDLPMVVLMNRFTASMGEITSAALGEWQRATLVGERTMGAVEASILFSLSDGSGINVAVARVTSGQGFELEGQGVAPEVTAPYDLTAEGDPVLARGLQVLRARISGRDARLLPRIAGRPRGARRALVERLGRREPPRRRGRDRLDRLDAGEADVPAGRHGSRVTVAGGHGDRLGDRLRAAGPDRRPLRVVSHERLEL